MNAEAGSAPDRSRVFLSYRRQDTQHVVGRLADHLQARFGSDVLFLDVDDIPLAADFVDRVDGALADSAVVLVAIGPDWFGEDESGNRRIDLPNDYVRLEIERALAGDTPIIPLLMREATMPAPDQLPASIRPLARRNGMPIRSDPDFARDIDRLTDALVPLLPRRSATRSSRRSLLIALAAGIAAITLLAALVGAALSGGDATSTTPSAIPETTAGTTTTASASAKTSAVATVTTATSTTAPSTSSPSQGDGITTSAADPYLGLAYGIEELRVGFTRGQASEEVGREDVGQAVFCEGFDVGVFQSLFDINMPGSTAPECELPDRYFAAESFGEVWCQGLAGGYDVAYRERVFESVSRDRLATMESDCVADAWWGALTQWPVAYAAPGRDEVASIPVGADLVDIELGLESVWVTGFTRSGMVPEDGTLFRIDPDTGAVIGSWALGDRPPLGSQAAGLAVGTNAMWVVGATTGTVQRVDPIAGITGEVAVGSDVRDVAFGSGTVWVTHEDGTVLAVDPRALVVTGNLYVDTTPIDVIAAHGSLWVLTWDGDATCELLRVDPVSLEIGSSVELTGDCHGYGVLEDGGGFIWVVDTWSNALRRVDPATNAETRVTSIIKSFGTVAYAAGSAWVPAHPTDLWGHDADTFDLSVLDSPEPLVDIAGDVAAVWGINGWCEDPGQSQSCPPGHALVLKLPVRGS